MEYRRINISVSDSTTQKKGYVSTNAHAIDDNRGRGSLFSHLNDQDTLQKKSTFTDNARNHNNRKSGMDSDNTMPIQRVIIGGETKLALGKTLGSILHGLSDIDLIRGDNGIDLDIKFDDLEDGTMGLTSLLVGGNRINPHTDITPELAQKSRFTILIQLNQNEYKGGSSPFIMGSLIETISHEWELHGRQHALNIVDARAGKDTLNRIDHVSLFSKTTTGLDEAIAKKILAEEHEPRLQQLIYNSYMQDVFAHITHLQHKLIIPSETTRKIEPVVQISEYLLKIVGAINIYSKVLKDTDPFQKSLLDIAKYAKIHPADLVFPVDYSGPSKLKIYPRTQMWIRKLNAFFQFPVTDDFSDAAKSLMREDIKWALLYLRELEDYRSLPKETRVNMDGEDDKEEWKRKALIPRMKKLAQLGVDVEKLNSKLSLRERGTSRAAHHGPVVPRVIRVQPITLAPIPTTVLKPSIKRSYHPSSSVSKASTPHSPSTEEEKMMALVNEGKLGLYHIQSVMQDFDSQIAKQILEGNKGPFKNKLGQEITFVARKSHDTFYFDAPYLH